MDFFQAIGSCFKNYANFSGRACRSEFWFFALFRSIISVIAKILDKTVLQDYAYTYHVGDHTQQTGLLGIILGVVLFLPGLAVSFRRLHDVNKSGWWLFGIIACAFLLGLIGGFILGVSHLGSGFLVPVVVVALIPILFLLYWQCSKGTEGDNRFGPDPFAVKP